MWSLSTTSGNRISGGIPLLPVIPTCTHKTICWDLQAGVVQAGVGDCQLTRTHRHNCQVTLDISGSPIDFQWGSRKYPGWLVRHECTLHTDSSVWGVQILESVHSHAVFFVIKNKRDPSMNVEDPERWISYNKWGIGKVWVELTSNWQTIWNKYSVQCGGKYTPLTDNATDSWY